MLHFFMKKRARIKEKPLWVNSVAIFYALNSALRYETVVDMLYQKDEDRVSGIIFIFLGFDIFLETFHKPYGTQRKIYLRWHSLNALQYYRLSDSA